MDDLLKSWHLWEDVLQGEHVDTSYTAWLLEDPNEYLLRRMLRTFEQREELLQRFGSFLFDAPPTLDDADVLELAGQFLDELKRLGAALGLSEVVAAAGTAGISIGARLERPQWCESMRLLEALGDRAIDARSQITGGHHLAQIALSVSGNQWVSEFLIAPLVDFEMRLGSRVLLHRAGHRVWLDGSDLVVTESTARPSNYPDGGWDPTQSWPSAADIDRHLKDELTASDPDVAGADLTELLQSGSTFAASAAAHHQNLPLASLIELAESPHVRLRTAAARNSGAPRHVLAQLAGDTESAVRLGVAANRTTPKEVIEQFEDEQDSHILSVVLWSVHAPIRAVERAAQSGYWRARSAAASHPKTPVPLVQTLAVDDKSDVRRSVATRSDLPRATLETLAFDASASVRAAVAANETTPNHILSILANDPSRVVARSLSHRQEGW